jgi:hypothetical protein
MAGPTSENLDLPGSPERNVFDPEEEAGNGTQTEEPEATNYQLDYQD